MVFAFYKGNIKISNKIVSGFLNTLGSISYSIYLLHPIVYTVISKFLSLIGIKNISLLIVVSTLTTFLLGWVVCKLFEEPLVKLGKDLLCVGTSVETKVTTLVP